VKTWGLLKLSAVLVTFLQFMGVSAYADELDPRLKDDVFALLTQDKTNVLALQPSRIAALRSAPRVSLVPKPRPEGLNVSLSKAWLKNQPVATGGKDWECLTEALYFEARGEGVPGQFAVAEVIMNRVKSPNYPASVCGVINQGTGKRWGCQFTYTCDGRKEVINDRRAYEQVGKVARLTLDGKVRALTDGATHYHTKAVRPRWAKVYPRTATIGYHIFYRQSYRTASN